MTRRRKTVRAAYITDPHCPGASAKALTWALGKVSEFKPDYMIVGGDVFEADAASRFQNEQKYDLLAEYEAGAKWLNLVHGATPDAEHVWLHGNHERNLMAPGRLDSRVRRVAHWNVSEWRESFLRWRQYEYDFSPRGCLQLGQVIFYHGFDGSEEYNALRMINATGGHAHRLVVGGHTHRPKPPTQLMRTRTIPMQAWYANGGTLGPTRPEWTTRQCTHEWAPGVVLLELQMGRSCQPERNWDCEVELMR